VKDIKTDQYLDPKYPFSDKCGCDGCKQAQIITPTMCDPTVTRLYTPIVRAQAQTDYDRTVLTGEPWENFEEMFVEFRGRIRAEVIDKLPEEMVRKLCSELLGRYAGQLIYNEIEKLKEEAKSKTKPAPGQTLNQLLSQSSRKPIG
jgi:hypothetical protein